MAEPAKQPKAYISYSWTSEEHKTWVRELAERLVHDGVDVVLDQWHLKPGTDTNAFMESMVVDSGINKVLVICDKRYREKANERTGGVGTEAQIISAEVYAKVEQQKFIPILKEAEPSGESPLPVFFRTRFYIDMTTPERVQDNYEPLVRAIYEVPLHKKPTLGQRPAFLAESASSFALRGKAQTFKNAVVNNRTAPTLAEGLLSDCFEAFKQDLKGLDIDKEKISYETIIDALRKYGELRNEFMEVIIALARYTDATRHQEQLRRFLEELLSIVPREDRFKDFLGLSVLDALLYTLAAMLKYSKESTFAYVADSKYVRNNAGRTYTDSIRAFNATCPVIEQWAAGQEKKGWWAVVKALRQIANNREISFSALEEVEFILWLRFALHDNYWYPRTVLAASEHDEMPTISKLMQSPYHGALKTVLHVNDLRIVLPKVAEIHAKYRTEEVWHLEHLVDYHLEPLKRLANA